MSQVCPPTPTKPQMSSAERQEFRAENETILLQSRSNQGKSAALLELLRDIKRKNPNSVMVKNFGYLLE